jgi:hypothetical protein
VLDTGAVFTTMTPELADLIEYSAHDLGHEDIDGLVGLHFLSKLNDEVRSAEQRILIEKIEP